MSTILQGYVLSLHLALGHTSPTVYACNSFLGSMILVRGIIEKRVEPLRYAQVSWSTLHGMSRLLIDGVYVERSAMTAMCGSAANMFWRELHSA